MPIKRTENLASLQPPVKNLILTVATLFEQETGVPLVVVSGYRSPEEQDALYAKGRESAGSIVTWVRGLFSWHNYGLAADVVPEPLLGQKNWAPESPLWIALGTIAKRVGFTWGGDWKTKDLAHLEFHPGLSIGEVRDYFLKTGEVLISKLVRPEIVILLLLGSVAMLAYLRRGR